MYCGNRNQVANCNQLQRTYIAQAENKQENGKTDGTTGWRKQVDGKRTLISIKKEHLIGFVLFLYKKYKRI